MQLPTCTCAHVHALCNAATYIYGMICGHYTIAQNHEGASYRIIIATYTASDHKTFHVQGMHYTLKYGRNDFYTRIVVLL